MQQINLYQRERSVTPAPSAAFALLGVVALALAALGIYYGATYWEFTTVQNERTVLSDRKAQLSGQEESIHQRLKSRQVSVVLTTEKECLERERDAKKQVLRLLTGDSAGNRRGFSGHLEGLARRPVKGLWLTGIRIEAGGDHLALQGSTLQADLVPQYLEALSGELAFAGHEFLTLHMERPEKDPARIDFDLQTKPGGSPDAGLADPPQRPTHRACAT